MDIRKYFNFRKQDQLERGELKMTIDEIEAAYQTLENRVQSIEANTVHVITAVYNGVQELVSKHSQLTSDVMTTVHDTADTIAAIKNGNIPEVITDVPTALHDYKTLIDELVSDVNEIKRKVFGQ